MQDGIISVPEIVSMTQEQYSQFKVQFSQVWEMHVFLRELIPHILEGTEIPEDLVQKAQHIYRDFL